VVAEDGDRGRGLTRSVQESQPRSPIAAAGLLPRGREGRVVGRWIAQGVVEFGKCLIGIFPDDERRLLQRLVKRRQRVVDIRYRRKGEWHRRSRSNWKCSVALYMGF